ncbi:hypothetical protein EJ110_NYTH26093 [Nymphaea thermarum]|nr:hypothetical protein EJ110_NYTH26093 [Nymphaea thermarum]
MSCGGFWGIDLEGLEKEGRRGLDCCSVSRSGRFESKDRVFAQLEAFASMETLVLLDQQQYVRQQETHNQNPVNCRSSQSRTGIFPPPFAFTSGGYYDTDHVRYGATETSHQSRSRGTDRSSKNKKIKGSRRSSPIPIASKKKHGIDDLSFALGGTDFFSSSPRSERWAGPTYSNSPPPSSLPLPKFSLRQKRSVSLELPGPEREFARAPVVKSAPPSPSRDPHFSSSGSAFSLDAASATKDLRRILHLDLQDN